jgi:hypothetical protein
MSTNDTATDPQVLKENARSPEEGAISPRWPPLVCLRSSL